MFLVPVFTNAPKTQVLFTRDPEFTSLMRPIPCFFIYRVSKKNRNPHKLIMHSLKLSFTIGQPKPLSSAEPDKNFSTFVAKGANCNITKINKCDYVI